MKRFLLTTLSTLSIVALGGLFAPVATAQLKNAETNVVAATSRVRAQPNAFNLVSHAYRGTFEENGIPSYGQLLDEVRRGKIDAADVVASAIAAGRVSSDFQNDKGLLNAVQLHLDSLESNS